MDILIQAGQFILSLSLLVLIHEFGHFFFARTSKARVAKFYLFFNPFGSILRAKRYDGRWHLSWFSGKPPEEWDNYPDNTEWGIGWLPFGGYCRICGMMDESMDKEELKQEPQHWEYRSKKPYQRMLISAGGVLFNFISALVIYSMILFVWGREILPIDNVTWGYTYCQPARDAGFKDGDIILNIDGYAPKTMGDAVEKILLSNVKQVVVRRGNTTADISLPPDFTQQVLANEREMFAEVRYPFVIDKIIAGSAAEQAGLQAGDSIIGINGTLCSFAGDLTKRLKPFAEQQITLMFYRNKDSLSTDIILSEQAKLGVYTKSAYDFFKTEKQTYGFWESIPAGIMLGVQRLTSYVKQFKIVFTKEGAKNLGGIGTIGSLFGAVWDWSHFWSITAFLSLMLAFLNILPIPAFDGGHMMFAFYEMVTRRRPSDKFMMRAQTIGMVILILLLVYANGNDIVRFFFK
jgi:regulator of sigma E protease